jgi:hypothetical protein
MIPKSGNLSGKTGPRKTHVIDPAKPDQSLGSTDWRHVEPAGVSSLA